MPTVWYASPVSAAGKNGKELRGCAALDCVFVCPIKYVGPIITLTISPDATRSLNSEKGIMFASCFIKNWFAINSAMNTPAIIAIKGNRGSFLSLSLLGLLLGGSGLNLKKLKGSCSFGSYLFLSSFWFITAVASSLLLKTSKIAPKPQETVPKPLHNPR